MIFYIGLIAYSDFSKFSLNFLQFKFEYIPLILAITFFSFIIKSFRQYLLLQGINVSISFKNNLLIYFSGMTMIVTPAGVGSMIRSYYLKEKYGYIVSRTFPITLIEKLHDAFVITIIILFLLILEKIDGIVTPVLIIAIISLLIYFSIRIKTIFYSSIKLISKIPLINKQIDKLDQSYESFYSMTSKRLTIQCLFVSLAAWLVDAVAIYFIFIAFGLDFNIAYTTLISFSSILFGSVTLIPGGIGVTEASMIGLLVKDGLELSLATSIVFMKRLSGLWYATVIGLITTKKFLSKN